VIPESLIKKILVQILSLSLLGVGLPPTAYAGLIGTQTLIEWQDREHRLIRVDAKLARAEVHEQMIKMGVDPAEAHARVAALSNEELKLLEENIDSLPAGAGILEVIGIVFVVLLVLELTGVINIFSKI
jgi:hypothetical protein